VNDPTTLYKDGPAPDLLILWLDGFGFPVNASVFTGWRVELVDDNNVDHLGKTTNVTGGDGTLPSNVVVRWTAAELAPVPVGDYRLRVSALEPDGRRRYLPPPSPQIRVAAAATAP
jgi:hypothetical protein